MSVFSAARRFASRGTTSNTAVPEVHVDLDARIPRLTWDTHGVADCELHWSGSEAAVPIDDVEPGLPIPQPDRTEQHWWITARGGVRSNTAFCYGPRCTVTDLRTRFSDGQYRFS